VFESPKRHHFLQSLRSVVGTAALAAAPGAALGKVSTLRRLLRAVPSPVYAQAQLLRQSELLAQHRLIGTWEVPNEAERIAALKLLRQMNVTNIRVRVVKP